LITDGKFGMVTVEVSTPALMSLYWAKRIVCRAKQCFAQSATVCFGLPAWKMFQRWQTNNSNIQLL